MSNVPPHSETQHPPAEKTSYTEAEVLEAEAALGKDGMRPSTVPENEISEEQKEIEARVVRKVDYRLIPILGLLYSVAGLDRVNLSNARVAGMNKDLHFNIGDRYSIALLVFFITYFPIRTPNTPLTANRAQVSPQCISHQLGMRHARYGFRERLACYSSM